MAESATLTPARRPAATRRLGARLLPGAPLLYLSVLVGLPIAALAARASEADVWEAVTAPQARSALTLTISMALLAAGVNLVTGILIAWVLVRDDFPGKRLVNAVIDLPFALPTIVAGLVLLSLYGPGSPIGVDVAQTRAAILLALLFVTLPFVVRSVQPVLLVLEREVEEAAACLGATPLQTFRRLILPAILPAALTGAGLAFARGLGEFGAIVLISGNLPFKTQVASVFIAGQVESGATPAAAAVSLTLLALALLVLGGLSWLTRRIGARRG
ncbi:sulfate ABC transporter permease subunit CysT [Streptomyces sp. NPDC047028]|uniref:sulfate ABC transporter permease subunit CysT n=1 Tax=Streptomyces sp. NPDC047028 TaxID=3155793 RepID=UPI0033F32261